MKHLVRHAASAALVVAFTAFAVGSSNKDKKSDSSASATDDKKAPADEKKGDVVKKLGETVTFDDSEWVVIEAKDLGSTVPSNNQFEKAGKSDDGKFVRVKMSIKNKGKKDDMLFDQPKLVDSQGREFGAVEKESFYVPEGAKTLQLEKIPVGLKKEYWEVFEVPKDAKGLKFQTRALEADGDKTLVDIGL